MLAQAGCDAAALECGAHRPSRRQPARSRAPASEPSALHNNCSGKHAGFVCASLRSWDRSLAATSSRESSGAARSRAVIESVTAPRSAPTIVRHRWLLDPDLGDAAQASSRTPSRASAQGRHLAPERAKAAARLRAACARTSVLRRRHRAFLHRDHEAVRRARFVKTGAEGVYCGALPEQGSASRSNATTARRAPPR